MQGTKEIKRRIKSVKSTKKITKAMELVAASKMKRAVAGTLASRLYAEYSWEILTSIGKNIEENTSPFFIERPVKNILLILITSNRGLCGAYNSQVIKKVLAMFRSQAGGANIDPVRSPSRGGTAGVSEHQTSNGVDVITVGKKGDVAMRRIGKKVIASFTEIPANISLSDILPISKLATQEYALKNYDKVLVAYTDFVSAMLQTANIKQILPVSKSDLKELIEELEKEKTTSASVQHSPGVSSASEAKTDYLIEGDKNKLIDSLAEKISRMQIYQMILESNASEQSSRMVAMKNASEAAGEMIDDLTLVYNKARQSNITREISEISAGMTAIS